MATIDIQIQNPCDHLISGEPVSINVDSLTILPSSPIASDNNVRLVRSGYEIPRGSYDVVLDPLAKNDYGQTPGLGLPTYKKLVLCVMEKFNQPAYELSYYTYSGQCPRCSGSGYSDDPVLDTQGDLVTISHEGLLAQSVEKIIVTSVRSSTYQPWYGTDLRQLIGTKVVDFDVTTMQIRDSIKASLANLKDVQTALLESNQNVAYSEVFGNLLSIDVTRSATDSTVVQVAVSYTNRMGTTLSYTQLMQLSNFRLRG